MPYVSFKKTTGNARGSVCLSENRLGEDEFAFFPDFTRGIVSGVLLRCWRGFGLRMISTAFLGRIAIA